MCVCVNGDGVQRGGGIRSFERGVTRDLRVVGAGVRPRDVARLLRDCRPAPPLRAALAALPPAELETVTARVAAMPLPDDVKWDGRAYLCFDGTRLEHHPALPDAVSARLAELNAEIGAENAPMSERIAALDAEADEYLRALPA